MTDLFEGILEKMKICPNCKQTYNDDTLSFCLVDGATLIGTAKNIEPETVQYGSELTNKTTDRFETFYPNQSQATIVKPPSIDSLPKPAASPPASKNLLWVFLIIGVLILGCGGGVLGLFVYLANLSKSANSVSSSKPPVIANRNNSGESRKDDAKPPLSDNISSDLTMEKYLRLQMNGSYQDAVKVLGNEGVELSSRVILQSKTVSYQWRSNTTESISLIFLDGKLVTRQQSNLSKRVTPNLSAEKFRQINDGMTYEEVKAILGDGDESSQSILGKLVTIRYQWRGELVSRINLTFTNGKLTSKYQLGLK